MGAHTMLPNRSPQTISRPVSVHGRGYWSGEKVRVEFRPAPVGSGIHFVRDDLGPNARIPALATHRIDVPRRTNLANHSVRVDMVEHILAALAGLGIDNCDVGVNQQEMPGGDGSSKAYVEALDSVGIEQQNGELSCFEISEVVRQECGESWIEARPATNGQYSVRFELDYSHEPVVGQQVAESVVTPELFRREIAPCRTFVLEREAQELRRRGLGEGVTNQDLLVFGESGPIDNTLLFDNECARHKLLDVIGDLALTGHSLVGQIIAHRSGHRLNSALAEELIAKFADQQPIRASA